MKTLQEHNDERKEAYREPKGNGIKCDNPYKKCDGELVDTGERVLTAPPKIGVRCPKCGWQGYRFE